MVRGWPACPFPSGALQQGVFLSLPSILAGGSAPPDSLSPCSTIWLSSSTLMYLMNSYPEPYRLPAGPAPLSFLSGESLLRSSPLLPVLISSTEALLSLGSAKEERKQYQSPSSPTWRGIFQSITFTPRVCLPAGVSGGGCWGLWVLCVSLPVLSTPPRPPTLFVSQPLGSSSLIS